MPNPYSPTETDTLSAGRDAEGNAYKVATTLDWEVHTPHIIFAGQVLGASLDVVIQDATTPTVSLPFHQHTGAATALTANATADTYTITVASVATISVGNTIEIFSVAGSRYYHGKVLSIGGLDVTLDTPLNYAYLIGDEVQAGITNMAVDGSVTRQDFFVEGRLDFEMDISRIIITMILGSAADDGKFGDIAGGITRGVVLRRNDGRIDNIGVFKDNGELRAHTFDVVYPARSGSPQNSDFGLGCRMTFNGRDKMGSVIRLGAGERIEALIQDDLSDITRFNIMAQGSLVTP